MSCFCHVSLYPCTEKGVVFAKDGWRTLSCMPTTNSVCCFGLCFALNCLVLHFIWRGMLLWCGLLFAFGRSFVCLSALFCFKVFCSVLAQNLADVLLCFCLVFRVLGGSVLFCFCLPCLYLELWNFALLELQIPVLFLEVSFCMSFLSGRWSLACLGGTATLESCVCLVCFVFTYHLIVWIWSVLCLFSHSEGWSEGVFVVCLSYLSWLVLLCICFACWEWCFVLILSFLLMFCH